MNGEQNLLQRPQHIPINPMESWAPQMLLSADNTEVSPEIRRQSMANGGLCVLSDISRTGFNYRGIERNTQSDTNFGFHSHPTVIIYFSLCYFFSS